MDRLWKFHRHLAVGIAASALIAAPLPALASDIYASYMALPYSETVDLAGGLLGNVSSLAGQQVLTVNNGSGDNPAGHYVVDAWCVDFPHHITIGSIAIDYTVLPLTDDHLGSTPASSNPLSASQIRQIGDLVAFGNAQMLVAPSNQLSAAVQTAIWDIEYGSHYAGSDAALGTEIASLEALAPSLQSDSGLVLTSFDGNTDTYDFQALEFHVPEPMTMSVLAVGLLGIGATRRRRG